MKRKRSILVLMGRYLPGHKDGGPVRTIVNLIDALGDEYDFKIVCLDRDHGDKTPYPDIKRDAWNPVGKAKVWYVHPGGFSFRLLRTLGKDADVIYCSSFYDDYGYKTLVLNRLGLLYGRKVAVASMGVFSEGAITQKMAKKSLFIGLCKRLGLFRNIVWSVTSEQEARDLKRVLDGKVRYIIAEDLPRMNIPGKMKHDHDGVNVVFLARICAHKGLDVAIDALISTRRELTFTIYGPIQEEAYWRTCQKKLSVSGIAWSYLGDVPSDAVQDKLAAEDVLILPTRSENYGHVIFEALSVGCIPVISDQTPWGELPERNAGVVVPVGDVRAFAAAVTRLCELTEVERCQMSDNAVELARRKAAQSLENTGYRLIFG